MGRASDKWVNAKTIRGSHIFFSSVSAFISEKKKMSVVCAITSKAAVIQLAQYTRLDTKNVANTSVNTCYIIVDISNNPLYLNKLIHKDRCCGIFIYQVGA